MVEATREAVRDPGEAWLDCMRRGNFPAAWRLSDAALKARAGVPCWDWPRHLQYIWDGRPLARQRVLVRCYHGLGDAVQFIRYLRLLKRVAAETIVWAQPALLPLLATAQGIDRLLPLHDGAPDAEFEVDVELMELPHVFRSTLATIPADVPYLRAEPLELAREEHGAPLKVGVVWQSGSWNPARSVPVPLMGSIAKVPGVAVYVLQDQHAAASWPAGLGAVLQTEPVGQLARAIAAMDLVVTVDSLPCHLAGALGVATWTLLPVEADWRWMRDREDSPWYPTMRLWRQQRAGEWEPVIARVQSELRRLVTERERLRRVIKGRAA
ncbi:MAG TPA: hypothetical protein VEQ65_04555 [Opitutus sp.]|nr:hypothetical protein [Opitutus sp.]